MTLLNRIILRSVVFIVILIVLISSFLYWVLISAPSIATSKNGDLNFSSKKYVTIDAGQGATSVAYELERNGIVRSGKMTETLLINFTKSSKKHISAGIYLFEKPQNAITIARRMANSDYGYVPTKVTIPEGVNSKTLASIFKNKIPTLDQGILEQMAKAKEGYLFPDTYFFPPVVTEEDIINRLSTAFEIQVRKKFADSIEKSDHSFEEIITMASILEEEVRTTEDRRMVADLLWRRIEEGMPLQVDATLAYINGKTSAEMTLKDLKQDNPYNTYTNKGLPPGPISNPGIDAIEAALNPLPNKYVFYLSDKDGITHFSKTLDEHNKLKKKYLR